MYLTVENINTLDNIISCLNAIENEKEQKEFLDKYVEDPELLFKMIKKAKKCKFPTKQVKHDKSNQKIVEADLYSEDEIKSIFSEKSNESIVQEYSLAALQVMYVSIYKKKPLSKCSKKEIVSSLRERFQTLKRAEAFALLAEKRNKKKVNIY